MKHFSKIKRCAAMGLTLALLAACSSCAGEKRGGGSTPTDVPTEAPTAEPTQEPEDPMRAKIIVIAGQSNAVGATEHSYLLESVGREAYLKYKAGVESVRLVFYCEPGGANGANSNSNYRPKAQKVPTVEELFDPVKLGQSWNGIFFGPEVGMAEYLSEHYPDETFYLIKVAKGDVSIPSHWQEDGACYQKLKQTMDYCLNVLEGEGYHPQIISFCWMQGENDANNDELTAAYRKNLEDVVARFRNDYAAYAPSKGIPLIDAGISSYWKNYEQVNAAKKDFADSSEINYYFDTMAEGLTYDQDPDPYHFDADSVIKLGALFASYTMKACGRE